MNTRILDAVCVLPRVGIFCDYLQLELEELEKYATSNKSKTPYFVNKCNRIRDLIYLLEEQTNQVYNNIYEIMEG